MKESDNHLWLEFCRLSQVPKIFQNISDSHWKLPDIAQRVADHCINKQFVSIIVLGPPGVGKTWFLYFLIMKYFSIKTKYCDLSHVYFTNLIDLAVELDEHRTSFRSSESLVSFQSSVPLLFWDDLGVFSLHQDSFRHIYRIIDKRTSNKLPTLISTNLRPKDFFSSFGERFASRLRYFEFVDFSDLPDLRCSDLKQSRQAPDEVLPTRDS